MKTGAVVVAAGLSSRMKTFKPMLELAGSTVIKRSLGALRAAGVQDITVVVGHKARELKKHLSGESVRIVENPDYADGEMFRSVRLGLQAMHNCEVVLFLPADIPVFSPETVRQLCRTMATEESCCVASPTCQDRKGHPVAIRGSALPVILQYQGDGGLRAALQRCEGNHLLVPVADPGILLDVDRPEDYEQVVAYAAAMTQQSAVQVQVAATLLRELPFWDAQLAALLAGVQQSGSLSKACEAVGVSYSKGWGMVRQAQYALGVPLLSTSSGGAGGGGSTITTEAEVLLQSYGAFEQELAQAADQLFAKHFGELFQQGGGS